MKIGFNTYDITVNNYKTELTVEEAGAIVIAYAEKKDIPTAKEALKIPKNILKAVYKDIAEVEAGVIRAMKGEAKYEYATYDEEGNELTPIVYNTIPTSLEGLKTLVFELVARDYAAKVQGKYTIEQVTELKDKVKFCIDKLIEYSKSDKQGDWDFFKAQF